MAPGRRSSAESVWPPQMIPRRSAGSERRAGRGGGPSCRVQVAHTMCLSYIDEMTNDSLDASRITGTVLLDFLNREAAAGRMHAGTAASRRSAVREVLDRAWGRDGLESLEVPFTVGDVPDLVRGFAADVADEFGEGTIRSYRSNFQRTVELYLESRGAPADDEMATYQFPIRQGMTAEIRLPVDLTQAEAKRLSALLEALALEERA
jgi:hypothetical protein